ncbi:MAG TPA: TIGR03435 family protein [Bryobacteraceae bacterium]|nr:TIGR03435 family protein [Bryobacteraceae bacterium]
MTSDAFLKWTVCSCALLGVVAYGQSEQPAFEVASVKPAPSQSDGRRPGMRGGPGTPDEGRIAFTNVTLINVLLRAYNVKTYQVTGPDWLSSKRYDISAKIPSGTTKERFNLMLQNLLAERFHLALHHETRDIQGFELIAGKNGPRLKVSPEADPGFQKNQSGPPPPEPASLPKTDANGFPRLDGPGLVMMEGVKGKAVISYLTAKAQPLSALVDILSREFRLPIVDKAGLNGKFDFTLEFAPQPPGALPPTPSVDGLSVGTDESGPNLITAVQQQLGLKLNPSKIPLDVLVIDRADPVPTEN